MKRIRILSVAAVVFMTLIFSVVPAVQEAFIGAAEQNELSVSANELPEIPDGVSPRAFIDSQLRQEIPIFRLPASLQIIGDQAFEGTAIVQAELPDRVERIGERAFSDIPTLRSVTIPKRTSYIARTAFAGSSQVVINGAPDSYARTWARENGIRYVSGMVLYAGTANIQVSPVYSVQRIQPDLYEGRQSAGQLTPGQQWRRLGDIKAEKTEQCIPNHLLGRAPPSIG